MKKTFRQCQIDDAKHAFFIAFEFNTDVIIEVLCSTSEDHYCPILELLMPYEACMALLPKIIGPRASTIAPSATFI
uniref:Uncharacterized protein n=1 Tax=Romanomermis culicivorax TaxID=13658 RepID=A0A915L3S5_ROMCU